MLERLEEWIGADAAGKAAARRQLRERIRRHDTLIRAWVRLAPEPAGPPSEGEPMSGIPFGVKDIIDTAGLATEFGSPLYKGRQGTPDAVIVGLLRQAGAMLLGKTQTAAFACRTPAPTRNPRNLWHTPGGSSSGSAAAVAAGMVPIAIGTQTHGSVLRPAWYCGVTGFKPTYGVLPTTGVLPVAPSLDTLGLFTHTPVGMRLLWTLLGYPTGDDATEAAPFGVLDPLPGVEPAMVKVFGQTMARLRRRGADLQPVAIVPMLDRLFQESRIVEQYEGARVHQQRFEQYGDRLLDVADLVRAGRQVPETRYRAALAFIAESRAQMVERYRATPVILAPAATGAAPRGLASTGDPRLNSPWTAIGVPAIAIPIPGRTGLPIGLQLTAAPGQDGWLLRAAVRVAALIA